MDSGAHRMILEHFVLLVTGQFTSFFELSITALSMLTPALLGYSGDGKHPDDVEGNTGQYLAF